ncbi:hypothetical protein D3C72_2209440 [compost metagenome]
MAQPGQLDTTDTLQRQIGDIYIEHGARWQVEPVMGGHQSAGDVRGSGQVVRLTRQQ